MTRYRFLLFILSIFSVSAEAGEVWHTIKNRNSPSVDERMNAGAVYSIYNVDEPQLAADLENFQAVPGLLSLPTPSGAFRTFRIWRTQILPPALAARYPDINTYAGIATDDNTVTIKLDNSPAGFHAMIFDGGNTYLIDPSDKLSSGVYYVRYKRDEQERQGVKNGCQSLPSLGAAPAIRVAAKTVGGHELRTYRIAIACDHQYAQAAVGTATPTKHQALNKIVTTLNRINGVYERELSVTFVLPDKEDTIIFVDEANDPFGSIDAAPSSCITTNQWVCDSMIGTANYDLGHVFTTGAGGQSQVGVVCNPDDKAQSVTGNSSPVGDGFDIDYVAHEIGHEFGADHTFNNGMTGACFGNGNQSTAYEPGSGSTLMAYAGICTSDDIQLHSDDYFAAISLLQIYTFITGEGNTCAVRTPTNNKPPFLPPFTASYFIPAQTPFELTAPRAVDSVADTLTTYCWEQWNLGDFGRTLSITDSTGPLFRSYKPDTSLTRIFPHLDMVLAGEKSNAGIEGAEGEKLPRVSRILSFRLTVRNILNGLGCFQFPDDSIHLDVINTGSGFEVTSQGHSGIKYIGGSLQTVTWNIAGTTESPISTDNVDIYLSADGGHTWPYNLGRFPNNGSAIVTLPNPASTSINTRIKVKGTNNVFFNINRYDITLITNPGIYGDIIVLPVPARNDLTIVTGDKGTVSTAIYDVAGKLMCSGDVDSILDMDVSSWPRGVYIIRMKDVLGHMTIKKVVLE